MPSWNHLVAQCRVCEVGFCSAVCTWRDSARINARSPWSEEQTAMPGNGVGWVILRGPWSLGSRILSWGGHVCASYVHSSSPNTA